MNEKDKCPMVDNDRGLREVLKENHRVIALFYASWCPFCVKILPSFQKHAEGEEGIFLLVKDDREKIADKYSVTVYPTAMMFEMGVISKRLDGVLGVGFTAGQLADFIQSCA